MVWVSILRYFGFRTRPTLQIAQSSTIILQERRSLYGKDTFSAKSLFITILRLVLCQLVSRNELGRVNSRLQDLYSFDLWIGQKNELADLLLVVLWTQRLSLEGSIE